MATRRALAGAAHDIAHHAGSGLSFLSPHMAHALRTAGLQTTSLDLLAPSPYPAGVPELQPLRLALQTLQMTAQEILSRYGFAQGDVEAVELFATPAPWDKDGYLLHTRAVIVGVDGRRFDSGWLQ